MRKTLTRITAFIGLMGALAAPAFAAEEGFKPLWNGRDFTGWTQVGGQATYTIEGDQIVGKVGPGPNTFLRTARTYGDFVLKLEVKLDVPGNSGIQFRSHQREGQNGRVFGYQCEIDPSPRAWSAGIYDEARRGWLFPLTGMPEAQKAFKLTDWNELTIQAVGPNIKTWLNGVPCADLVDTMDLEGFIALQVHSGKEGQIRWRNIRLKELGQSAWKPLWDGTSLAGWKRLGGGDWKVADGAIQGTAPQSEARPGYLMTEKEYGDFAARVKYLAVKGDSGLYFRSAPAQDANGIKGLQAQVHPESDAGAIYDISGRGWLVRPKPEDVKKWFKPNAWNEMTVVAQGGRITVHVNGIQTAELKNDASARRGRLALQLHGGQDMDVRCKDLEIIDLD